MSIIIQIICIDYYRGMDLLLHRTIIIHSVKYTFYFFNKNIARKHLYTEMSIIERY